MAHVSFKPNYATAGTDHLYAVPDQRSRPSDFLFKAIAVEVKHYASKRDRPILDLLKSSYGDGEAGEKVRAVLARLINRAASIPADMSTSGWADTLIQTVIGDLTSLLPQSIYQQLRELGDAYVLGRNGAIMLPARSTSASVGGSFVAPGAPIPVRQGAFLPISLTPKKLAVITTATREIMEHSVPAIESILRTAMLDDTAVSIDNILLDATDATEARPAGLKYGVTKAAATAGGGIAALIADMQALATEVITGARGHLRAPVWLMNPIDVLAAGLMQAGPGGAFPFSDQLSRGMLFGIPVLQSTNVAAGSMLLVDAADFVTVSGDTPEFAVSDQAVLHMEDAAPEAISTAGSPASVVAAPVRSMFQSDSIAVRMLWPMNWALRRTGTVSWTDEMSWPPAP